MGCGLNVASQQDMQVLKMSWQQHASTIRSGCVLRAMLCWLSNHCTDGRRLQVATLLHQLPRKPRRHPRRKGQEGIRICGGV